MSSIREIRTERAKNLTQFQALLDRIAAERREATPTEDGEFDRLNATIRSLDRQLELAEGAREDQLTGPATPIESHPFGDEAIVSSRRNRRATGKTYAAMFGAPSAGGWKSPEEFYSTIHAGLNDPRLNLGAIGTVGVPSEGGFTVPEQRFAAMLDKSLESEIFRPRCEVVPMTSMTAAAAGFDCMNNSSGTPFGFTTSWTAEAAEITTSTGKLRKIVLEARKLAILAEVSNELLADGVGFAQQLEESITKAIGWGLDSACISGSGSGQPLGLLNAGSTISVAKESGQAAATINYTNLIKMLARLHPACFGNAIWLLNPNTLPQVLALSQVIRNAADNDNVGGSHYPVLSESDGQFRILTRPVIFTEKASTLGTVGDVILVDPSQYVIGLRRDMSLDKSMHPGFSRDTTYYRGILRVDGQPKWSAAFTPKNGTTLSWAVTLATRS